MWVALHVVVAEPHQRVVDDVPAHLVGAVAVEVHRGAPRVRAGVVQVWAELRQVVSAWPEVVVDDVLDDADAAAVAGVHERLVRLRASVLLVHGVPEHAVVAPVVAAVEAVHGQQFDEVDAEGREVIQAFRGGGEGALSGEGADVQFVDDTAGERPAPPVHVSPAVGIRIEAAAALVHAAGLPAGARVGQHRVGAVDEVAVVDRGSLGRRQQRGEVRVLQVPPAARPPVHGNGAHCCAQVDPVGPGRPDGEVGAREVGACHGVSLSSATG
jgi:hypothetical protein